MDRDADRTARGLTYLEHLTAGDLALLARHAGPDVDPAATLTRLRARPELAEDLLGDPALIEAVFPTDRPVEDPLLRASPFLVFAVAVARTWHDLHRLAYVQEWAGTGQRLPVFVSDELRDLLDEPALRLYLAQLLASYTRVASGAVWVRTSRGPRRRRFSELDLGRLASLLEVLPEAAHPGVYRRLGDLALFLTGVFPDHTQRRAFGPVEVQRLGRAARPAGGTSHAAQRLLEAVEVRGTIGLLEQLGTRWYRLALDAAPAAAGTLGVVGAVADRFGDVRRTLNHLTDRYLFPFRTRWFPSAA
ncbi:MAG TPA: hypothetical protein VHF25_07170 [Nitriliruptorales bacterium]|nr:hypothetical protein [Nitriliruptorales bacterium]